MGLFTKLVGAQAHKQNFVKSLLNERLALYMKETIFPVN